MSVSVCIRHFCCLEQPRSRSKIKHQVFVALSHRHDAKAPRECVNEDFIIFQPRQSKSVCVCVRVQMFESDSSGVSERWGERAYLICGVDKLRVGVEPSRDLIQQALLRSFDDPSRP